jgi:hypothetical protein
MRGRILKMHCPSGERHIADVDLDFGLWVLWGRIVTFVTSNKDVEQPIRFLTEFGFA